MVATCVIVICGFATQIDEKVEAGIWPTMEFREIDRP
jgi:hypothetical protein